MKVIFLDIDGVLNSEKHAKEMHALVKAGKLSEEKFHQTWDLPYEGTLKPLKRIVDSTGAIIVLSSSWRIGGLEHGLLVKKLLKTFKPYGLTIVDVTPQGVPLEKLSSMGFDPANCYDAKYREGRFDCGYNTKTWDRGAEIASWLSKHKDVTSFVILDDDWCDIVPYYEKNYVQTDFYDWGLTEELADKAIEVLNG